VIHSGQWTHAQLQLRDPFAYPTSSKIDGEAAAQSLVAALVTKQSVDLYNVQGEIGVHGVAKAINYLNLVKEFGTRLIAADDLLERFQRVLGHKPYRFMRRGIVFSHRDFRSDPRSI
jgi:hypothetical protein